MRVLLVLAGLSPRLSLDQRPLRVSSRGPCFNCTIQQSYQDHGSVLSSNCTTSSHFDVVIYACESNLWVGWTKVCEDAKRHDHTRSRMNGGIHIPRSLCESKSDGTFSTVSIKVSSHCTEIRCLKSFNS
jgi:hypothetical protein